jgi:hypothetical protein
MAVTVVQSNSASTTTSPATVVLGAAPTAGNTLVAIMASDTTHTGVPTAGAGLNYTQRISQVNNEGFYIWTRLVVSGDSATTTFTPNGAFAASLMVIEVAGTYDKIGTGSLVLGTSGSTIVNTGLTPATTDGMTISIGGIHSVNSALGGGSVDNGFTMLRTQYAAGNGSAIGGVMAATLVTTTTTATGTTTFTFTGSASDRDGAQIAFTGTGGGAPAIPPILIMQTRRAY